MSFRLKLGIAFCSVLLLTITVALASWWGMETALKRQNIIFSFSLEVDRLLNTLSHQEHAFTSSQDMNQAIAATDTLDRLTRRIETLEQQSRMVTDILDHLGRYQEHFTRYTGQSIDMETMKSRMIQESDRLLSHARQLAGGDDGIASATLQQISLMLQAEKDFMLFGAPQAADTVKRTVSLIEQQSRQAMHQTSGDDERLKAFRISKVAAMYQIIFSDYLANRQNLHVLMRDLHASRDLLAEELRQFVDSEQLESQKRWTD